jgi:hypothetical protein
MSLARDNFFKRLATLKKSLTEPALSDGTPTDIEKNAVARMLRSGLAVLAFAITEDFIRERTAEALRGFTNPKITFNNLSEPLQNAVTISAMKGILLRSELEEKSNQLAWFLNELPSIANVKTSISNLSKYSFGYNRSNLTNQDLKDIISAFGANGGWQTITQVAKRIGLGGILDYSQAFTGLAKRRHRAAHTVAAEIPLNDLNDSVNAILGICSGFDLLLSHALSLHNEGTPPTSNTSMVVASNLKFRFISAHPTQAGKFREQTEVDSSNTLNTYRVHATLADAIKEARPRALAQKEQLIILGNSGIPDSWITW